MAKILTSRGFFSPHVTRQALRLGSCLQLSKQESIQSSRNLPLSCPQPACPSLSSSTAINRPSPPSFSCPPPLCCLSSAPHPSLQAGLPMPHSFRLCPPSSGPSFFSLVHSRLSLFTLPLSLFARSCHPFSPFAPLPSALFIHPGLLAPVPFCQLHLHSTSAAPPPVTGPFEHG